MYESLSQSLEGEMIGTSSAILFYLRRKKKDEGVELGQALVSSVYDILIQK